MNADEKSVLIAKHFDVILPALEATKNPVIQQRFLQGIGITASEFAAECLNWDGKWTEEETCIGCIDRLLVKEGFFSDDHPDAFHRRVVMHAMRDRSYDCDAYGLAEAELDKSKYLG